MLLELLRSWGAWNWIIGGLILLGLEIAVPGASLFWLGIAALVVGCLTFLLGLTWQAQAVCFAIFALLLVIVGRRVVFLRETKGDPLHLNERSQRLYGHSYPLAEPILNGVGRIKVDDGTWGVSGPDLPAGVLVRVTGHDGTLLTVVEA